MKKKEKNSTEEFEFLTKEIDALEQSIEHFKKMVDQNTMIKEIFEDRLNNL